MATRATNPGRGRHIVGLPYIGTYKWNIGENGWKFTWHISGREKTSHISRGTKRDVRNQSKFIEMTDFIKNIGPYRWNIGENGWKFTWHQPGRELAIYSSRGINWHVKYSLDI